MKKLSFHRYSEFFLVALICVIFAMLGSMASWFYWLHVDGAYPGSRMKRAQVWAINDPSIQVDPNLKCQKAYQFEFSPNNLYYLPGEINDKPVTFLFDTGSNVSSVPMNIANELGWIRIIRDRQGNAQVITNPNLKFETEMVETANGMVSTFRVLEQKIEVAGKAFSSPIIVLVERSDYAIIGLDVLNYFNLTMKEGILSLKSDCLNG